MKALNRLWSEDKIDILCIGAHSDDIEIGCGATIMQIVNIVKEVSLTWVVLSSDKTRAKEARHSVSRLVGDNSKTKVFIQNFRNAFFPYQGKEIKNFFEELKGQVDPDLIFTHRLEDRHQDHRTVAELTWNTFRDHTILEYEIPKYEGDLGHPNVYVPVDRALADQKIEIIMECFRSQLSKTWLTRETFIGLMRLRGIECNSRTGLAEGFYSRKSLLEI